MCENPKSGSPLASVCEITGEPAIIINGVPNVPETDNSVSLVYATRDAEQKGCAGLGKWMQGRQVQKLFRKSLYSGSVTKFDDKTGWYRVVYQDGDFEDLDWHELEEILVPLDVTLPLNALALNMLKMSDAITLASVDTSRTPSCVGAKRKTGERLNTGLATQVKSGRVTRGSLQLASTSQ